MKTSERRGHATRLLILGCLIGLAGGLFGAAGVLVGARLGGVAAGAAIGLVVAALAGALVVALFPPFPGTRGEAASEAPSGLPKPVPRAVEEEKIEIPPDRIDALTGLANANGLAAWFVEKRQRLTEDRKIIVVLVANLDLFEEVERIRGKSTSDAVLIEVAKRMSVFAGEDGIAARTSGDEFVAVASTVPDHALEFAEERAGKMAETIGRPVELGLSTLWIGGSVGAAVGRPAEGDGILARARTAFAEARRLGLGRYFVDKTGSGK
jgi:diguanylate cyclase (GGDEF)-like protein